MMGTKGKRHGDQDCYYYLFLWLSVLSIPLLVLSLIGAYFHWFG
ncbi:hypothetical protein ACFFSY_18620 [Paenibacillus aurantiacus]|uniref:Uncharacterized protein n=1 Tax=Paenibacillus aurantiacus TaxID=1936118 RepID=A0ABV5KRV5_9BACL